MKMFNFKSLILLSTLASVLSFASVSAHAETEWQKNHPRRKEVNKRLKNQQKRVDNGLAKGKLNPQQASKIQNQDARIRSQEQRDAAANGGHITQGEQKQLNHEENHMSHEIHRDETQ